MTLLSMINRAQDKLSLPRSAVIASTDPNVRLLLAEANDEGVQLARRYTWEALATEQTFTSVAQTIQTNAIPSDFDHITNHTMFNRSQNRRVLGPLNAQEWQAQQALSASLLTDAFRIQGGNIQVTPTPDAGDTYAYEYTSKNWCQSAGGTAQAQWAIDTDTGILDENLMGLGVVWRWRKARGFDYAEEMRTYEIEVDQAVMRDGGRRSLNYSADDSLLDHARPPLVVEGNWPL